MKKIITLLILIMTISTASAIDLSEFPELFLKDGPAKLRIIIGKAADVEDVIGAIGIAATIQHAAGNQVIDVVKLDSEVKVLSETNSIIVGGPCANAAAAKLLGYPSNCMEGFEAGKGQIKLYEFDNGHVAMLVAGALAKDTRRAAKVIADYKNYELTGTEMEIQGYSTKNINIAIK